MPLVLLYRTAVCEVKRSFYNRRLQTSITIVPCKKGNQELASIFQGIIDSHVFFAYTGNTFEDLFSSDACHQSMISVGTVVGKLCLTWPLTKKALIAGLLLRWS